ncbi:MAG: NifU family protein [Patescibacteria group bacterium]|nr:NifU family protein [Patescibacteria group bacterium]MDD4610367.1 NifU family protein [Patescibacteria group bacterium]
MKKKVTTKKSTESKIKKALDKIRPALQMDGGDVELISWDEKNKVVKVHLVGRCAGCPMSQITLKQGVAKEIIKAAPEVKDVVSV